MHRLFPLASVGLLFGVSVHGAGASPSPAQVNAPISIGQAIFPQRSELSNPDWQIVPAAEVGRHPAETLMDLNGITPEGDRITFDVMGYRGAYYRLSGDCVTGEVAVIRQGITTGLETFEYTDEIDPSEITLTDWHSLLLTFACQQVS